VKLTEEEKRNVLESLESGAVDFRKAYQFPGDHLMIARVPAWIYSELLKGDHVERMLVDKHIKIEPPEEL